MRTSTSETLCTHSVEGFLTAEEVARLVHLTRQYGQHPTFNGDRRRSVHSVPGLGVREVMQVYEPHGRTEVSELPSDIGDALDAALRRALPSVLRVYPSVTGWRRWAYVEYDVGQYISAHVDGRAVDMSTFPQQVAGISVALERAQAGGEFYVETASAGAMWSQNAERDGDQHEPWVEEGADESSEWFRNMDRTRWQCMTRVGDALLYGAQIVHGTVPVRVGRERKFLNWLVTE